MIRVFADIDVLLTRREEIPGFSGASVMSLPVFFAWVEEGLGISYEEVGVSMREEGYPPEVVTP